MARPKKKQPKPLPKKQVVPATNLEEFQATYGYEWLRILEMPAFRAGMQLLNVRALDNLSTISDEQISKYGPLILSGLIGQLRHEDNLLTLHKATDHEFPQEEQLEYKSPEEVAEIEQLLEKLREKRKKAYYGS